MQSPFKKKTNAILHVNKHEATLIDMETGKKTAFSFTHDILENLEIVNTNALRQRVTDLTSKTGMKPGTIVMVLSNDFLFSKSIASKHPEDLKRNITMFLEEIPFETEKIVHKKFSLGGNTLLMATNKNFFTAIKEAFAANGWDICYVVPETIFALLGDGQSTNTFNIQEADKFLYENTKLIKKLNFTDCGAKANNALLPTKVGKEKAIKIVLIILGVLLILGGIGYAVKTVYLDKKNTAPIENTKINEEIKEATEAVAEKEKETPKDEEVTEEESEDIEDIDKSTIKIQILNGAGITGLAGDTSTLFIELGYIEDNISLGNADTIETTLVTYKTNTEETLLGEIEELLSNKFVTVILEENPTLSEFDMTITLGNQKELTETDETVNNTP